MNPTTTFSAFDSYVVHDLLEMSAGDPDFLQTQYDHFFEISETIYQKIHHAYAKCNWDEIQFQAHSLASSASILGAVNVRKLCLSLESESKNLATNPDRPLEKLATLVRKLGREIEAQKTNFDLDFLRIALEDLD